MISYKQCEEMIGPKPLYPETNWKWRAYKDGKCQVFETVKAASAFSTLVEKFVIDEEEYKIQLEEYYAYEKKVNELFLNELKKEHDLPEKIFNICYAEAYERGHSAGYDEVANYMYDVVEFYEKIRDAQITDIMDD